MTMRWRAGVAIFAMLSLLPAVGASPYVLTVAGIACILAIVAQGANLVMGVAGQASFAHAAFYGLGAYVTALLSTRLGLPFWATLPAAVVICYIAGYALAYPALRVKGFYLGLITLGVSEIFTMLVTQFQWAGGAEGITSIPAAALGDFSIQSRIAKYYLVLVFAACIYLLTEWLCVAHFGRVARSVKDSEAGAMAVGIDLARAKTGIFAASAAIIGVAGWLYAYFIQYVSPVGFGLNTTILVVSMVVVGGMSDMLGALVGALVLSLLPHLLRDYPGWEPLIYGALLVIILLLVPEGVVPSVSRKAKNLLRRGV